VIHRDLKPSNICLTPDGIVKILDFGLARVGGGGDESTSTESEVVSVAGTPRYMAPEQLLGKGVDARTDVYGAGAVLYEMATGSKPFADTRGAPLVAAILNGTPIAPREVNPALSPALEQVILKAIDRRPELRYQTARELLVDLERLLVVRDPASARSAARDRGPRALRSVVLLVVVALVGVAAWLARPPRSPRVTNVRALSGPLPIGALPGVARAFRPWASDGERVYYVEEAADRHRLLHVALSGGAVAELAVPFTSGFVVHAYLPSESALLVGAATPAEPASAEGRPLWLVPVPGGAPRRLGSFRAESVAVSRGDGRLALLRSGGIRVVRKDGTLVAQVDLPGPAALPTWTPDGRALLYVAMHEGIAWLWEWEPGPGAPRRVRRDAMPGALTPDGRLLFFAKYDWVEHRADIHAAHESPVARWWSPSPLKLTHGPLFFDNVGLTPDGKTIVAWGTMTSGELLRYDAAAKRFVSYLGGESALHVDHTRDGSWATWASYPHGTLFRGRTDGSEKLRLTEPGFWVNVPKWSPDGQRIVFVAAETGENGFRSLYVVGADGGGLERLARADRKDGFWAPCWLPEGDAIVYSSARPDRPGIRRLDLKTRLTDVVPGSERLLYPSCSTRGDLLAVEPAGDGFAYWILPLSSQSWQPLAVLPLHWTSWAADGTSFIGMTRDGSSIVRWRRGRAGLEPLVTTRGMPIVGGVGPPWMGATPDGSPLVLRDRSVRQLYALDWEAR
jgi:hypothetical protein